MASNWLPKGNDHAKENNKQSPKNNYPIVLAKGKGKVHLSKRLMAQINTLHMYAGDVEWSGPLFYNVTGSLKKPDTIEIEAHAMYPMDIGTAGYTEYEFEEEATFDMHDYYPEILEKGWDMGHMHTHHNMRAYFSGTDEQELRDNTPNHAYYLSLIVNHAKQYVARLCVMAKRKVSGTSNVSYKGLDSNEATNQADIGHEQDIVYAVDLEVTFDDANTGFLTEVIKVHDRKKAKVRATKSVAWWRDYPDVPKINLGGKEHHKWVNGKLAYEREPKQSFGINQQSFLEVPDFDPDADQARDFCYKWLKCDPNATGHFRTLLMDFETQLANGGTDTIKDILSDQLDESFHACWEAVYGDMEMDYIYDTMQSILTFLSDYQTEFEIVEFLIDELLSHEIPEEPEPEHDYEQ